MGGVASIPQFSVPCERAAVGKGDLVGRWELFHLALPLQATQDELKPLVLGRAGGWETRGLEGLGVPSLGLLGTAGLWFALTENGGGSMSP